MQPNGSYGGFDLQAPMRNHHHHHHHHHQLLQNTSHPRQGSLSMAHHTMHENFPLTMGTNQEDQNISLTDYNKADRGKSGSDEDEPEDSKGKKSSPWQRVKWTDTMVRLLITAVSYITEEAAAEHGPGSRRKYANLQKKGKWKSVSKVMAERGHFVSPQQCEDKFNDLNKRYKRLNEILGRGTSCEVVENPSLLDVMDNVPEKLKEEVRKILSSKHLHYEEMCSYHNGNRLHLPPDPDLQRSLRLALRSRDENDENDLRKQENDEAEDHDGEFEEYEEDCGDHHGVRGGLRKRAKNCGARENFLGFDFRGENVGPDPEGPSKADGVLQKQWMSRRSLELEEERVHIEAKMLELEKERFKWQRFCRKKDREMEIMRMEIERMKLENERMALQLRRKEMGIDNN